MVAKAITDPWVLRRLTHQKGDQYCLGNRVEIASEPDEFGNVLVVLLTGNNAGADRVVSQESLTDEIPLPFMMGRTWTRATIVA